MNNTIDLNSVRMVGVYSKRYNARDKVWEPASKILEVKTTKQLQDILRNWEAKARRIVPHDKQSRAMFIAVRYGDRPVEHALVVYYRYQVDREKLYTRDNGTVKHLGVTMQVLGEDIRNGSFRLITRRGARTSGDDAVEVDKDTGDESLAVYREIGII